MVWSRVVTVLLVSGARGVFGAAVMGESQQETKQQWPGPYKQQWPGPYKQQWPGPYKQQWPGPYPGITFEELQPMVTSGDVFLLDVRNRSELLNPGRLPNSLNLPLHELDEALQLGDLEFLETYGFNLPEEREIILTCRSGRRIQAAANKLIPAGYTQLRLYYGSFKDWVKHDAPISREINFTEFQTLMNYSTQAEDRLGIPVSIVDIRARAKRNKQGHIEGSFSLPMQELESALTLPSVEFLRKFGFPKPAPHERLIIVGADENQTLDSVPLFNRAGYHDLRLYLGSPVEWLAEGGHVVVDVEDLPDEEDEDMLDSADADKEARGQKENGAHTP